MSRTARAQPRRTGKRWKLKRQDREKLELLEYRDPTVPWYALDYFYMALES